MTEAVRRPIVTIKVVGVGGGGGNAINDIVLSGLTGAEYVAVNTDKQDLEKSLATIKIQIGEKSTNGQGAGADPSVGREAAEEDIKKFEELLADTDMLFITAGMGGGTGTGAAPILARVAREKGILTLAVVTKPFSFEGKKRKNNAEIGIELLKESVDSLVIIPNDRLFDIPDKTITLVNAFKEANDILRIGIKAVVDLIMNSGLINLDFADFTATLKNSGYAVLGFGEGEGENRTMKAIEKALHSPLLERSVEGANNLLINIASADIGLAEAQAISDTISERAGKSVEDVMFGVSAIPELGDKIQITVIATNFKDSDVKSEPVINVDHQKTKEEETRKTVVKDDEDQLDLPPWKRK